MWILIIFLLLPELTWTGSEYLLVSAYGHVGTNDHQTHVAQVAVHEHLADVERHAFLLTRGGCSYCCCSQFSKYPSGHQLFNHDKKVLELTWLTLKLVVYNIRVTNMCCTLFCKSEPLARLSLDSLFIAIEVTTIVTINDILIVCYFSLYIVFKLFLFFLSDNFIHSFFFILLTYTNMFVYEVPSPHTNSSQTLFICECCSVWYFSNTYSLAWLFNYIF